MSRGKAHPPETRAAAEALLLQGVSQGDVCAATGLDSGLISRWARALGDRLQHVAAKTVQVAAKRPEQPDGESDADLIMGYFRAALKAMRTQAEVLGEPDYVRSHNPRDVAIAHGVMGDKLAGIAATAQALGLIGPAADTEPLALPEPYDGERPTG